jgi:hypothetical protein
MAGIAAGAGGNAARLEALSKEAAAIGGLFCFQREMVVASARGRYRQILPVVEDSH